MEEYVRRIHADPNGYNLHLFMKTGHDIPDNKRCLVLRVYTTLLLLISVNHLICVITL
jgi:hypothetical protein